jgi:hypothetical protein
MRSGILSPRWAANPVATYGGEMDVRETWAEKPWHPARQMVIWGPLTIPLRTEYSDTPPIPGIVSRGRCPRNLPALGYSIEQVLGTDPAVVCANLAGAARLLARTNELASWYA